MTTCSGFENWCLMSVLLRLELLPYLTIFHTDALCSPSKVTLTRSQLPTEEIAAGPGKSSRKSWQYHAVQLLVGTSLRCHWPRSQGIPKQLSLWSFPRFGFLHLNRLYAGAQCMIGLLVGGSATCPLLSGEFSTYHYCLGQVLSKHTTKPYWL